MKTRTLHRALSMLLTAAMVMNIGLTPVFAEGVTTPGVSGVCTHHTEHTEDCGYRQGTPCNHEHTEDCYTKKLTCPITTGDTAGDAPEVATDSDADIDSDAVVDSDMDIDSDAVVDSGNGSAGAPHTHGEDCFTKTDNCTHIHDETCGYTPDSPCSFDPASCTQCDTGDKQPEQDCPCPPVDSGEPVHGENCPLYTAPPLSEAVQALIAMVDALPNPEDITEDNKDTTLPDFEAAAEAYGALSEDDKAAFDETPQHTKLMALRNVLLGLNTLEITTHRVASEEDLTKAINDANTGDTIQLAADFGFANNIIFPADKALVLDLNSKTLVANPPDGDNIIITIETGAELTITDSGSGGTLMREDIGEVEFIVNSGILNINSGTILVSSTTGSQLGVIINKGTFNFTGGNFLFNASGSKYIVDNNGGDVTIDGVTLEITDRVYVVRNFEGGNVNIENSTIRVGNPSIAENLSALVNSNGTATITDSTISASGAKAQAITNGSNGTAKIIRCNITNPGSIGTSTIGNNGNLEITGGKLSYIPLASDGADGVIQNNKDLTIHSGVFTSTGVVINNIGGTSVTINDGTFVSTSQKYPALEVGGTYTVNNGIIISVNNGKGDVVELLNKVHGTTTLTENVNIPAGKTLTVPAGASLTIDSNVTLSNGGTLDNLGTVTNNGTVRNRGTVKTAGSDGNGIWNGAEPVAADANVTVGSDFGADYASIYDAWSEAGNTAVITLISDVSFLDSMGMAATAHKNITLDLNGYTLEYTGIGAGIYVDQGNTLTFKNGVYIVHNYSGYLSNAFSYRDSVTSITLENCLILGDGRDDAAADAWKVHGTATLYNNYTLAAGKTLTVPVGTTLTIPAGVTLTNAGTIDNKGTIVNNGTISSSGTLTGSGSISGNGAVQTVLAADMITLSNDSYVYTGSAFEPTVTVASTPWTGAAPFVKGDDYTVEYSANTGVGTATVTVTPTGSKLTGTAVEKTFTITKANSALGLTTNKTDNTFTYGDTITFTANVSIPTTKARAATVNTVDFYCGDTKLNDSTITLNESGGTGSATFAYKTTSKGIPIGGDIEITAEYGGSNNLNGVTQTINVTLSQKPLTATVNTSHASATKVYDGNANFTGVALTLTGLEAVDSGITATASGTAANANVDASKAFTATGVTLSGTSKDCYTLTSSAVTGNVAITAANPTVSVTAAAKPKSLLRTIIGNHNDTITLTATTGGVNGEKPNGSVVFKNGNNMIATVNTTNGVATYDWANPPAGSITVTAEFTASDTETNYTQTAVTGTADAFDIDKGAQSALTVNVPVLTYGDTGKSLTTSGGSTNGTVTYNVTGDCVTVGADGAITVVKVGTAKVTATMPGNSDYNDVTSVEATITVDPATPTISWGDNTAQSVTYTGTEAVLPNLPTVTGIAPGDTSNGTITYQHKSTATKLTNLFGLLEGYTAGLPADAGEYKIIATVAADGNYAAADSAEMTLTIEKSTTSVTINSFADTTYTGKAVANPAEANMSITGAGYADVKFTYYADNSGAKGDKIDVPKNAGTYHVEASIAETANTATSTSAAVKFTIAKAPLTIIGGTVTQREYDSTTAATVTALTFDGLKNGETLAITADYKVGTPAYDSADAGANKTVSGTAVLESNAKTSNYTLTGAYSITNQTISKKTGIAAPSYAAMDNTGTTKSFTFGTVSGYTDVTAYEWKLDTDADTAWASVTVNPITFGNRAGKMQVRVKGTTNYEAGAILTHGTAFTATLEGSVSIDGTATYGETLTAKPTGTQTGAILSYEWKSGTTVLQAKSTNDTYKIDGTAVGDTITVEVTATSYTGSLTASTTAVAKRNLTVTAAAQNKEYDGGTAASVRFTFGSGEVLSGDAVTATATGTFANKNVGDGKTVNITGFALGGAAKDYYTVTTPPTTATANITAKALTVGDGTLVITKAYDTTTTFTTSTGSLGLTGVVGGETVGVKIDSYGAAADANVGTKTLSLGISLDGADKDNYTVTSPYSFTKASITAKAIIPTIESIAAVTYDGTAKEPALTVKDGNTVLAASDYTAIYSDNTNAGENTGKVAVTLKGNYDGSANATFTIHKAAGLTATTPNNILMIKGQEKPYTFNLSTIALSKTDAGAKTYTLGALTDSNSIFKVAPSINGAEMTFTSNSIATPATNQATQVVTISTQNYADTTVTISFDITDKTPVTITGLTAATNLVYNGSAQNGYTGTAQFSPDWSGTLTYTYYVGTGISGTKLSGAPKNAGTYTVVASIPDSDTSMAGSHAPITFTIGAKEITVAKGSYKVSKTYDGTTSAGTSSGTLSVTGILPTDGGVTVVPGAISAYSDSAVKSNYDIALPITISGDTNSNYKLVASTVTVPGEITKASVTATIDPIAAQTYTGSQQRPAVTVKVGGNTIADSNYTVEYGANVNAGTGSVTVKAKATGNYTFGDVTANFTINKAAGPAISGAVTGSYTGNGTTFTYTIVSISGAEYKMDSGAWQDSNVFAGIAPMSKHTFSARMKETANYEAGTEKAGNEVNFAKLSGVAAPALAYTVSGTTGSKTIAITTVTGAEYQFGSDAWSDTNTKTYSTDETVTIGIRMKTTPTHEAGTAATASVNLAKQEQTAPAAFTLTYAANGETNYTVTIPEVAGCEYSFDGATYNSTRTKTASVGDTVTGYMRKAETTTHNASPAVSASVTLPMFKVQPITASPSDRNFSGSTSVSLASDTAGAEIYYTTNGSTPSIASTKYTAAFTLTETTTVKAIAIKTGMTDSDVASFTFTKNSGGGGTGGGGGGVTPAPDPKPETPTTPTTAESNVNSKTDKDGNATAAVEEKDITNAIDKAQKEAKKNGTEANGIAITLNVKTDKNASTLGVTLPQKSVSALIAANVTSVTVKNGLSTVTLDLATLKALAGGDVILSISKADPTKLSTEAKAAIGNRPVFQFSLTSGGKPVSDFKGGRAGLQIPYTLTTTEQAGNLCGVYVDANGKVNWLEASSYDPITGMMLISAQHFSTYGIGYKQSTPKFTDVGTHWARNDIDFVVARGLLTGTSNTTFAPETSMTRGMFVTSLGRLAGVDTKKYSNTKFTDVAATAYYSPYVAWASANNIVTGTSDTTFSPDKAITRQEMAVMLVNYSKAIGYKLPSVHAEVSFVDSGSIASWAKDAVKQMQMAGILMGKSGNRFDPTATATRAEVSAMLRRFVELVVNTETAEGWAMNESGQWMYIQDGKRVTGSKTIGGKSYTFDQLGVTTALPPERKYLTYTVQAGDSFWAIALKYKVSIYELAKVNNKSIFSIIHPGDELKIPQQ